MGSRAVWGAEQSASFSCFLIETDKNTDNEDRWFFFWRGEEICEEENERKEEEMTGDGKVTKGVREKGKATNNLVW